jgi:large repetitive protein
LLTTTGTAHTATANGEYKVKIIDNINLNCFATSSWLSVTLRTSLSDTPVACCATTINRGSTTVTATLTASNCPPGTTYIWSDSQIGAYITVSPTTTTKYTVKCRETNVASFCESANSVGVDVTVTCSSPTPILEYDNPTSKVCPDQNISIKASGCNGTIKWYEAATGGSAVSTGTPYTTNKGTIWATCTASGSTCESARTSIETQIDFGLVGILTTCDFDKFTATPTDESKYSYEWAKNNVTIVGQTKSFIDNPASGSYVVTVGLKGSQCAKKSSNFSITLPQNKRPTVSLTPSSNVCGDITLTATLGNNTLALPPYSYVWKKDGVVIDNEVSNTYAATSSGAYTVIVTSNNECSGQATLQVTVTKDLPKPTIKNTYGYSCYSASRTMTLEAQGCTNGSTPKWSTGATTTIITVTSAGTYTVKCEKNGCSGLLSDAFVITECAAKPTYCGQVVSASGGGTPYDNTYDYNGFDGNMNITFNTFCVPDKMIITRSTLVNGVYVIVLTGILPKCMGSGYNGNDTSYFSKDETITYTFPVKQGDKIRVQVSPDCASGYNTCPASSTIWNFTISCPDAN